MECFFDCIAHDLEVRGRKKGIGSFLRCYFHPQGGVFRYTVWLRICQALKKKRLLNICFGLIAFLIRTHYEIKYGVVTPSSIHIGPGLNIVHGSGVYLNCRSIGRNLTVFQGVTLGRKSALDKSLPTVGNDVMICAGAVVLGGVHLGDGCVVAANAVVTQDVAPNTVVGGVPAKFLKTTH